jgi:hypothetical protein
MTHLLEFSFYDILANNLILPRPLYISGVIGLDISKQGRS